VLERIGDARVRAQTGGVMRAAYRVPQAKEGVAKLKTHAS
jgi:hypothetical protein